MVLLKYDTAITIAHLNKIQIQIKDRVQPGGIIATLQSLQLAFGVRESPKQFILTSLDYHSFVLRTFILPHANGKGMKCTDGIYLSRTLKFKAIQS